MWKMKENKKIKFNLSMSKFTPPHCKVALINKS